MPKCTEPDLPKTAGTSNGNRKRIGMRYNRYGDEFLIDNIQPNEIGKSSTTGNTPCRRITRYQNGK